MYLLVLLTPTFPEQQTLIEVTSAVLKNHADFVSLGDDVEELDQVGVVELVQLHQRRDLSQNQSWYPLRALLRVVVLFKRKIFSSLRVYASIDLTISTPTDELETHRREVF